MPTIDKAKEYCFYLCFLAIAVLAFGQISFFIHPAKWDMMDCFYPWRFYIGECLQNGKLPLWNPYQDLGYPIHADPSSGAWYPLVWMIGYIFGYNVYTIGFELWIHVFFAAIGFYKLSITLNLSKHTAFLSAVSYMLCGVFIGNAQHLPYVISACWLPFILNYYLRMFLENQINNSVKAAFFLFLLITGGYPAFTIILFYLLLIFCIYYGAKFFVSKDKKQVIGFLFRNILFIILTLLLSSGMLFSVYEVTPYISRMSDFSLADALFCPFSPQSSVSFLLPLAAVKDMDFFATDLSMTNAYFGILMFLFFVLGVFIKKPVQYWIVFVFALFSLLAAFGAYLPVREFLFKYVPMMNLFRFPSAFRLFTIIGFLLVGAYWFDRFMLRDFDMKRKWLIRAIIVMITLFLSVVVLARCNGYLGMGDFVKNNLFSFSKTSTLFQHLAFQAFTQSIILGIFLIVVLKVKEKSRFIKFTTVLFVFEMIFNMQLNAPYTVYYEECSAMESYQHIKKFPSGFPQLPDKALTSIDPREVFFGPFWRNVGNFHKQIHFDGFNSFSFTGHAFLRDNLPQLHSEIIKNKIIYLSDKVYHERELDRFIKDSLFSPDVLFFNDQEFEQLKTGLFRHNENDSARLVHFAPDSFIVHAVTAETQILTLMQNNYKGWSVLINGKPVTAYTSNKSLISVVLPAGENNVSFVYNNTRVLIALWISILTLFLCLIFIVRSWRIQKIKTREMMKAAA